MRPFAGNTERELYRNNGKGGSVQLFLAATIRKTTAELHSAIRTPDTSNPRHTARCYFFFGFFGGGFHLLLARFSASFRFLPNPSARVLPLEMVVL